MATMQTLAERTRLELADHAKTYQASVPGDGLTVRFDLPDKPVAPDPAVYSRNNATNEVVTVASDQWTVNEREGTIIMLAPPAVGTTLVVVGTSYRYFTDAQITAFIESAVAKHNIRTTVTIETLPTVEVHLVAILAAIEALWVLATDASYDIDVYTPEGVAIHRTQRRRQLMDQIAELEQRYRLMSQQLNVGMGRIEITHKRRISKRTGRLVPVFLSQEIDDRRRPIRLYPPIDIPSTVVRPAYLPPTPDYPDDDPPA